MNLNDFTQEQITAIYSFLTWVNECNKGIGSDCKVDGLQMFKNKYGQFYASYFIHGFTQDGQVSSLEYIEIDRDGMKIDLSTRYPNKADIAKKLSRYEEIRL